VLVSRCSNNYGPNQHPEKLIPTLIRQALAKKPLPIYGDGKNVRDWIFVADHCQALMAILGKGSPGEIYNVGGNCEKSNLEIAKCVINRLRQTVDPTIDETLISFVEDRKGHDWRYAIDASKMESDLSWKCLTPFDLGIQMTIDGNC
jgi:dTDP-glucose 4,6-dehydratase